MTVLIIEESLLIGGRLRNLLLETGKANVVYQSVGHKKAAILFDEYKPQVVLLDMCLQGSAPVTLLQKIKTAGTGTTVLALVDCDDYQRQLKCTTISADYILDKYHEFEKIPGIIDTIVRKRNLESTNEKPEHYSKLT